MKRYIISVLAIAALTTTGCRKKKQDQKVPYDNLTATTSYHETFKGEDNNSSVDMYETSVRQRMLKEVAEYMQVFYVTPLNADRMKRMFTNTDAPFIDSTLNNITNISLYEATAQSAGGAVGDAERQWFLSMFDSLAANSVHALETAQQGVPGAIGGTFLINGKGFEQGQFLEKGFIGAMLLDQIANVYLGSEKMAADNTTPVSGKNYTQLEHNWDMAMGYLTQNAYYPMQAADGTWQEYFLGDLVRQVNGLYGNPSELYLAFLKGRAAIVNKDMGVRDQQIATINKLLERAMATVAVSYLNKAEISFTDASRFHALSQAIGCIYALRWGHSGRMSREKSEELMGMLMNSTYGFWTLTKSNTDAVKSFL